MAAADFLGSQLGGRSAHHVNRAIARWVDEDFGERACTAVERQMMTDTERIHAVAQEFAVGVVAHLAEDAGVEAEDTGPAQMVEHNAPDRPPFRRGAPFSVE